MIFKITFLYFFSKHVPFSCLKNVHTENKVLELGTQKKDSLKYKGKFYSRGSYHI